MMDRELSSLHRGARRERRRMVPDPGPCETDGGTRSHFTHATGRGSYCGGRCFMLPEVRDVEHIEGSGWDGWMVHGPDGAELWLSSRYWHEPEPVSSEGTITEEVTNDLPAWREELDGGP